ncbi:MAG: hypothetical protein K0S65_1554 [Labilithrix sp.]|nr:hypothetical protein [Labilithrix sp.]
MSSRWTVLIVGVAACASTESLVGPGKSNDSSSVPEAPPAEDGGLDAAPEGDAGPCADCEYFPSVCSPDTLCPNGPFESSPGDGGLNPRLTINVIRGRSVSDVWVAGAMGSLAHFDGTSWTRSELGSLDTLNALWLHESGEIALARLSRAYTHAPEVADAGWTFTEPTMPSEYPSTGAILTSAWSASGSQWLWGAITSDSWATGLWRMRQLPESGLELQVGVTTEACVDARCMRMKSIHGASADAAWAVGESGSAVLILDADGDTPSVRAFNTQTKNALNGVWSASPSDAWTVGATGTIRHYTGDRVLWDVISDVPTLEALRAVWGSSSTDVWAVGDAGVVLHYDGKSWSRVKVAGLGRRRPYFTAVWVPAPGHVWVGGDGVMLSLGGKP